MRSSVCYPLPLWVGVAFLSSSAFGGSGCRVSVVWMCCESTQRAIALYKCFRRLSGRGWFFYRSHSVGRLYALYLRSVGPLWVAWYIPYHIPHIDGLGRKVYSYCDNNYIQLIR